MWYISHSQLNQWIELAENSFVYCSIHNHFRKIVKLVAVCYAILPASCGLLACVCVCQCPSPLPCKLCRNSYCTMHHTIQSHFSRLKAVYFKVKHKKSFEHIRKRSRGGFTSPTMPSFHQCKIHSTNKIFC